MKALLAVLIVASSACDKEMSREPVDTRTETRTVSCTYAGVCQYYDYQSRNPGMKFGFSMACDGRQPATVRVTQWRATYQSGASRVWEDPTILERAGTCR